MDARESLSVLVVEDEKLVRDTVRMFLEGRGCQVATAEDGVEGLEAVRQGFFNAIVTDIRMPRADGIWLWREAVTERPELRGRFIFVSGVPPQPQDGHPASERFLAKPFRMTILWECILAVAQASLF